MLDTQGFNKEITAKELRITISNNHPLIKLANKLPWQKMLDIILPDLQKTEQGKFWVGRPLKIRAHLGIYLLQQMYNLTDRQAEYNLGAFPLLR